MLRLTFWSVDFLEVDLFSLYLMESCKICNEEELETFYQVTHFLHMCTKLFVQLKIFKSRVTRIILSKSSFSTHVHKTLCKVENFQIETFFIKCFILHTCAQKCPKSGFFHKYCFFKFLPFSTKSLLFFTKSTC
jgi:hypothetical protein